MPSPLRICRPKMNVQQRLRPLILWKVNILKVRMGRIPILQDIQKMKALYPWRYAEALSPWRRIRGITKRPVQVMVIQR